MKKRLGIAGISIGIIVTIIVVLVMIKPKKKDFVPTNLVWRYGWNMSKDSLVFCYNDKNMSIYKKANEKSW